MENIGKPGEDDHDIAHDNTCTMIVDGYAVELRLGRGRDGYLNEKVYVVGWREADPDEDMD